MGKTQKQKTSRKPTKNNIWRLFAKAPLTISKKKSRKPKNQKTKTLRECLVWGSCLFFLVLPSLFCFFGLDLEKTKKLKAILFFWIKWWLKKCEKPKKLKVVFLVFVALVSFWLRNEKPKKPWVFLVFHNSLTVTIILSKKTKKPWVVLVFSRSRPKNTKKPRQNQKKHTLASDQTFSEKFFLFFWFSRGFGYFVFPKIQPKSRKF